MRDYPNGGFFFIDAVPIQAAGAGGLKIEGIFEDAKRAIAGGKVFVLTNFASEEGFIITGTMSAVSEPTMVSGGMMYAEKTIVVIIARNDVVTIESN